MAKSKSYYRGKIGEMIQNDDEAYKIFKDVDAMFHGDIALPPELDDFEDIKLIKDSSPHDALYNATVVLANSRMNLSLTPLGNAEGEFVKADRMEEVLKWNWNRANMRGTSRKIWSIAHSALRYDLAVTRVDDLMYHLPKNRELWSRANQRAARAGRFVITVIPVLKVHFRTSEIGGAFEVVNAQNLPLSKVLEYYESIAGVDRTGKQIKATIEAIKAKLNNKKYGKYEEMRFMLYQYTDDEKRFDSGHIMDSGTTEEDNTGGGDDDFVFINSENKVTFMNYTARGGASDVETDPMYTYHPMLAGAEWHDLWKNTILTKSLVFSEVIRRLREIRETYEGSAAELVEPDDGSGGAKALPPGTTMRRQPPSQIDPQAIALMDLIGQGLNQSTSASTLGNLSRYSNAAFSTMNAIIQVEMGKLNPQRNIIQDTIADECYLFCEWAKFTKKPLQAWRGEAKRIGERELPRGEEIQISEKDYDLDRLFINCTITPETPTDRMQTMNIVEKLVQMGMSQEEGLEMMNVAHADLQKDKRSLEILKDGVLQALIQKITEIKKGEAEIVVQKMMQAAAPQPQPQPGAQPGAQPGGGAFGGLGGGGFNPAEGGEPPIEGAPGMGREQMTGTDRGGRAVAA